MTDRKRAWSTAVGFLFIGLGGGATWNCGGSSGAGLQATDGGLDGAQGFNPQMPGDPGFAGPDASNCRASGAGCVNASDCCRGACAGGTCSSSGVVPTNPASVCGADSTTCSVGFDCCSGTCNGGKCAAAAVTSADGGPGSSGLACTGPTGSCTMGPDCCSGLCEPVTGMAGVIQCRDACRADGVACVTAQDCCSLGCFGGVCAAKECTIIGDTCAANADCCSGVCDPALKQCNVDLANSTCRPTGEDCGKGHNSGCCGATNDNDLCDQNGRCGLPPGACRGQKAECSSDGDCCSKHCDTASMTCTVVCAPAQGPCKTGADCCTSSCTNGTCDPPQPPVSPPASSGVDGGGSGVPTGPACSAIGAACTSGATCCSTLCLAGFCDQAIQPIR